MQELNHKTASRQHQVCRKLPHHVPITSSLSLYIKCCPSRKASRVLLHLDQIHLIISYVRTTCQTTQAHNTLCGQCLHPHHYVMLWRQQVYLHYAASPATCSNTQMMQVTQPSKNATMTIPQYTPFPCWSTQIQHSTHQQTCGKLYTPGDSNTGC